MRLIKLKVFREDLKLNTEYWVCDSYMACGATRDNVFLYNPTFFDEMQGKNILIFDGAYIAFTEKSEAIELSEQLYADHHLMYTLRQ